MEAAALVAGDARIKSDNLVGLAYYISSFSAYLGHSLFTYGVIIYANSISRSPAFASYLFLALCAPIVILGLYGGVLSDRYRRKRLLMAVQLAAMVMLAIFALEVRAGYVGGHPALAFASVGLYGMAVAFTPASRISLAFFLFSGNGVERATIIVKVLNTLAFGCSPFLGGMVKERAGWMIFFLVPMGCMVVSNLLLALLPTDPVRPRKSGSHGILRELLQGLAYIATEPLLLQICMMCAFLYTLLLGTYQVLIPAFAQDDLRLSEFQRGLFLAVFGTSLLLGGIASTLLGPASWRGRWILASAGLSTAFFIGIPLFHGIAPASICLAGSGLFGGIFSGLAPSALQSLVPDELRGRVMSIYYVLLAGTPALGGVIFGFLAKEEGLRIAIMAAGGSGLAVFCAAGMFSRALKAYA
jgi:MFS family permease